MRICIISDNKNSYSSKKFLKEARASGIKVFFTSWKNILFDSARKTIVLGSKFRLKIFDAVILRSSETSLTPSNLVVEHCEYNNIRLLNKYFYLRYQSVNKLHQQLIFQTKKIPCLKTIYSENISFSFLKKELGSPFVAKIASGSLGKQVFKINSKKKFLRFIQERAGDRQLYLFQKFYKINADYRVFIVGENVFGPMKRIAPKGEWRTNVYGSISKRVEEKKQLLKFAKTIAKKTHLEFAGLDILIDSSGKPRIIEINTMACFKVFDKVYPEINIAKKIIESLIEKNKQPKALTPKFRNKAR